MTARAALDPAWRSVPRAWAAAAVLACASFGQGAQAAPGAASAAPAPSSAPGSAPGSAPVAASGRAPGSVAAAATLRDDRDRAVPAGPPARRVVSLLPSLTEVVCSLGECARLVGTDRYSNWPASVQALPKLGGLEDTQIERLVALQPDLVLAAQSSRAVDRLDALGLRVLVLEPRTLADTRRALAVVAQALGDPAAGTRAGAQLDQGLARAAARVPAAWRGRSVYFEVASTPHAAGEASFVGELLHALGLRNVVPAVLGPFPQLNPEFILRAQPDVLMATAQAVAQMPQRPGWSALAALREGRRCGFPPELWDTLVRPGPRLAAGAAAVADCLAALPPPPPPPVAPTQKPHALPQPAPASR